MRGGGTALAATSHDDGRAGCPTTARRRRCTLDGAWINSQPLTLAQLRGKVVLIDFWTYSCINCLRTLPHLKAWYAAYHDKGLVIIGVHTPEFAFEHVTSNVRAAVKRLGIKYPVMQDNRYKTWDNYANQYWPAEYLIDKQGHVRHTHFGEGEYDQTESLIRRLLGDNGAHARQVADATPTGLLTPESYLGYARLTNYAGTNPVPNKFANYRSRARSPRTRSRTTARGASARRRSPRGRTRGCGSSSRRRTSTSCSAATARCGRSSTASRRDDQAWTRSGSTRCEAGKPTDALLELRFSPGVQAYSFTFG